MCPGYTFRIFVTNRSDTPEEIWRDYNRRADMENRIAELKHDLGTGHFCLKQFHATEAAFRAVLLLFNLLAEFHRAAGLPGYREPATIRTQILNLRRDSGAFCPPPGSPHGPKLGWFANEKPSAGQYLAMANSNFAEVAFRPALLSDAHRP